MKILIIEDSDPTVELMQESLAHLGAEIRRVSRLGSGLQEKAAWSPDFVFLDLELPDSPRASTIKVISRFNKDSAVIVFSEVQDRSEIEQVLHQGADAFLRKVSIHDSGDLLEGLQEGWKRYSFHSARPTEELDLIAGQLRAPNTIKDLARLTKSGRVPKAILPKIKEDPIGAEVLRHIMDFPGMLADVKVKFMEGLSEVKTHLTQQDIENDRKWEEQKAVDQKILEQTTLHNGRLTDIETWQAEKEEIARQKKNAEDIKQGAVELLKLPFRTMFRWFIKIGWKPTVFFFGLFMAASSVKDFLVFLFGVVEKLFPHH